MFKKNLITVLLISFFVINSCYAVTVGDSYDGGTVFCVSKTSNTTKCVTDKGASGDYGLIMANEDQVNYDSNSNHGVTWSSEYKTTNAQSFDNGASNTKAIIEAHPKDDPSNNAAWLCHNYKDKTEGHNDWYLPSKNELNKMYLYARANNLIGKNCKGSKVNGVQCLVGGGNPEYDYKSYCSSSEYSGYYDSNYAWNQYFSSGNQDFYNKIYNYFAVRAVRAFNNLKTLNRAWQTHGMYDVEIKYEGEYN